MNAIDPDGMDVYILGQDGKMILARKKKIIMTNCTHLEKREMVLFT